MGRSKGECRLAAIIAADVAGYSRLMQEDAEATLQTLNQRRALFAAEVEATEGRIVNAPGDSVLGEFASVVNAVQCAVNVQRAMAEANAGLSESRRMLYRVGVNLGDVLADSAGIYGDGVNIAARLEQLAPAGGICVSQAVRDQVRTRIALQFEDLGEQTLKNIAEPVRVFRVVIDAAPVARVAPTAAGPSAHSPTELPSIAVLPFINMTGDPEQEYFADGMVEDITTALARTGQFFVIARNSSFVYKGRAVGIKQVGRELGVRYVLEGSVRKVDSRIRISGQLIEAESGSHMWADRFDGALEDVFDLQDRITESVVGAIAPSVERAEIERALVKPTNNLQAYDLLMRAQPGTMPGASKAQKDEASLLIDRALRLAPHYSLAKGVGAVVCLNRVFEGQGDAQDVKTGLRLADEALADHRDNPMTLALAAFALATLGYRVGGVTVTGFRYDEALHAIDRALSLTTNLAFVTYVAGIVRLCVGDGDAAIPHFERTMHLSPLDPGKSAAIAGIAVAHNACGRCQEGLVMAERAIRESPNYAFAHLAKTVALAFLGRIDEAKFAAARLLEVAPEFTVSRYMSTMATWDPARLEKIARMLRAAGVPN